MMGVLGLLVLVYQLCTIGCVVGWQHSSLLVSNQLLCPTPILFDGGSIVGCQTGLRNSLLNVHSGMTLPPVPVSTLHLSVAH